ncbi:MAG: hypothetical protein ACI3ZN_04010 [Candidatus Cryptobacteroides sp.]
MKRNIHIKLFSALVALWYVLCVSGFDVHTCRHTGDSVVRLLAEGIECSDVHPDDHCHSCHHTCHSGCETEECTSEELESDNSCCFNEISVLVVPGISPKGDGHNNHHFSCHCGHCPLVESFETILPDIYRGFTRPVRIPVPSDAVRTILSKFGFWRI